MHPLGQRHIAQAGVLLQRGQQLKVDAVEWFLFHESYFNEIKIHEHAILK